MQQNKFYVLLAIDGAGKSTLLNFFNQRNDWNIATYDKDYIPNKYSVLKDIDHSMKVHTLKQFPRLSRDFKSAIYSTYVYYLRDQVEKIRKTNNVICNGYYYKILGKDIICDGYNDKFHISWKNLPQPDKVIFLDTPPEVAFERIENINELYWNEYYADKPSKNGFIRYQHDLKKQMLKLVSEVETEYLDGKKTVNELLNDLNKILN